MKVHGMLASLMLVMVATVAHSEMSLQSLQIPHKSGDLIVTFEEGTSEQSAREQIKESGGDIVHRFRTNHSYLVRVPAETKSFISSAQTLSQKSDVSHVGLNRIFSINATPTDPNYDRQYQHQLVGSEQAWEITKGDASVVVAVIDTGVIYDHPDLIGNYWTNPGESGLDADGNDKSSNGIDDDNNGYVDDFRGWDFGDKDNDPTDSHGHGTHCAGSIGASANNDEGIAGMNWEVSLVGLKFIGRNGQGTEADAIEAVEYATMMGFDITSNSWGGNEQGTNEEDLLYKAIKAAGKAGVLFVAASGNDGRNTDKQRTLPASYDLDNIISVGASDARDNMTGFSNYGVETVDLMAPGAGVFSTTKRGFFGNIYGAMSGTSMAAPIVAGAAALVKAAYPKAGPLEIKERLLKGVDPISSVTDKLKTGGRLNVYNALTL